MNNLTIRQTEAKAPAPLPSRVDTALTKMLNGVETVGLRSTIQAHLAPSPEQRAYLGDRAVMLDVWLSSAGPDRADVEIAALFDCMAMKSGDEMDLRAKIKIYIADLSDLPAFALSASCRDFRLGVVGDGKWVPTQGEIRRRALAIADPHIAERARIRRVMDAAVVHPPQISEKNKAATADLIRKAHGVKLPDRNVTARKFGDPDPPKSQEQLDAEAEIQAEAMSRLKELGALPCPLPSERLVAVMGLGAAKQNSEAA